LRRSPAIVLAQDARRPDLAAMALESLAEIHVGRLDIEQAAPVIALATTLASESGSLLAQARATKASARLCKIAGRRDEADEAFRRNFDLNARIGNKAQMAWALNEIGSSARGRGDHALAERSWRRAIDLLDPLGDRAYLCEAQRRLAELLYEQGRLAEAERLAQAARRTVSPHDVISQATTLVCLGIVRFEQGRRAEGRQNLLAGLRMADRAPIAPMMDTRKLAARFV
jgi:tetratricopeptide (TPR) repeat protein